MIGICIPHQVTVTMEWAYKTFAPIMNNPDYKVKMCRGAPLPVARNEIVKMCLEDKDISHLMWVDSDMICSSPEKPVDAINMLLSCNVPIVSGLYRAKQAEGFGWAAWTEPHDDKGFTPLRGWNGNFFGVAIVGFGFCLIKREVFERVLFPWFTWDSPMPSEDFNFCIKARQYGYNINVFSAVQLAHEGNFLVHPNGNFSVLGI
jgi:hypothetical protein